MTLDTHQQIDALTTMLHDRKVAQAAQQIWMLSREELRQINDHAHKCRDLLPEYAMLEGMVVYALASGGTRTANID